MEEVRSAHIRAVCLLGEPWMWGSGHNLKYRKLHSNTRKIFFTVRAVRHWHRCLRGIVESPCLEILSWTWSWTLCSRRAFQPRFCESVINPLQQVFRGLIYPEEKI